VQSHKVQVTVDEHVGAKRDPSKPHYTFFLFVNSGSGDSKAALLTKLQVERMTFSDFNPNGAEVELRIHRLNDAQSRDSGMKALKKLQLQGESNLRVIVGGGDGSIMWAVQEMIKADIDFDRCPIGTIPFGTGNDFSRVLGWGPTEPKVLIGTHMDNLKALVTQWVNAEVSDFDIWDITIETHDHGGLKQIHRTPGQKFEKRFMSQGSGETANKVNTYTKVMCNYYSFGVDSRIGYGFDKGRTKSRLGNKVVYCWEGFKKFFTKTPRVNDVVENIQVLKITPNGQELSVKEAKEIDEQIEFAKDDFVMYPGIHIEQARVDAKTHMNVSVIKGNPSVFLCLNIPSYMGGASNPWKSSKGKLGAHNHDSSPLPDFDDQKVGDGKIEILAFGGPIAMATERMIAGQGRRLGQAKGPFIVNFKKSEDDSKPLHTYMQVDGEFYDVVAPKRVKVASCPRLPNGKIKVLVNTKNKL